MQYLRFQHILTIVLVLPYIVTVVQSRLVKMTREDKMFVIQIHNDERMKTSVRAADMTEMVWDTRLQQQAEDWARKCVYKRPPYETRVGANLYYKRDYVHRHSTVRRMLRESLGSWAGQKNQYVYSTNCGAACLYVQMIHSRSNRIGCAVNTCENLQTYREWSVRGTLFVCLYSPQAELRDSFPYSTGPACSRCPRGSGCLANKLCSEARYAELIAPPEMQPPTERPFYRPVGDMMLPEEKREVIAAHNDVRRSMGRSPLTWDPYLERFSNYVINCSVDYPGPRHAYTNFHRFNSNAPIASALVEWQRDRAIMPARGLHKCRTPFDREQCNHYSNMMTPSSTRMACATRNCYRTSRQMVCLYDNVPDRSYQLSEYRRRPARYYRPRPPTRVTVNRPSRVGRPTRVTVNRRDRTRWYRDVARPRTRVEYVDLPAVGPAPRAGTPTRVERRPSPDVAVVDKKAVAVGNPTRVDVDGPARSRGPPTRIDDTDIGRPVRVVEGTPVGADNNGDGRDTGPPARIGSAISVWPSQGRRPQ